jgi:hypothetical protein
MSLLERVLTDIKNADQEEEDTSTRRQYKVELGKTLNWIDQYTYMYCEL